MSVCGSMIFGCSISICIDGRAFRIRWMIYQTAYHLELVRCPSEKITVAGCTTISLAAAARVTQASHSREHPSSPHDGIINFPRRHRLDERDIGKMECMGQW
eukprot:CAMPEP_0201906446 /NCGR_PEP_ID=MMETSP0902-20130614/57026_1 /ASSEMBLY_ACC=CAM_ASM_000551 /TAXON_ID=420261 /ORGANISM="Thalassiosira antarctica, Strain CCMP982" /LENGTH=101 /DNA_ID=CAMNT_0048440583 /DNA_START=755 /DNA_END=1057 /DNA_ORIENTATION=-